MLSALEFGRIDDGQPADHFERVGEQVGVLVDGPQRQPVGFTLLRVSDYDPDAPENAANWKGPRFDVPQLGLSRAAVNEIFVATRALYGDEPSLNRSLFSQAVGAKGAEAYELWLRCLQSGDGMAHFALGYTLLEMQRFSEAYRHLRHYTEISPNQPWNWVYRGRAAWGLGDYDEARRAYRQAIALERDGSEETDAAEQLEQMERDERAVRFEDFVETLAFDYRRMSAGLDEYVVLDVAGSAIVLQLAPDDELTIRAELADEVDGEDHDDVLEDLKTLITGDEYIEIDRRLERAWIVEPHGWPHPDAQRLRGRCVAVAQRATLLASQITACYPDLRPPMTYAKRAADDCGPW